MEAMRAHATQIAVDGPFFALSNNLGNRRCGASSTTGWSAGRPAPDAERRETDLFAGLD